MGEIRVIPTDSVQKFILACHNGSSQVEFIKARNLIRCMFLASHQEQSPQHIKIKENIRDNLYCKAKLCLITGFGELCRKNASKPISQVSEDVFSGGSP